MGHYKKDGPHMESAKQERKNLLKDNPVVRDMDSSRPWMSKHFKSSMSPLKDMHGSPAEKDLVGNQKNLPQHLQDEILAAPEMRYGMEMRDGMEMGAPTMKKEDEEKDKLPTGKPKPSSIVDRKKQDPKPPPPPPEDTDETPLPPQGMKKLEKKIYPKKV